jgi:hypothetical protein
MMGLSVYSGVASTALTIRGQQQAAKAQATMQHRAAVAEQKRHLSEVSSLRTQQRLQQVAVSQKLQESALKAREARSTAYVSAGELGTTGTSVDALLNEYTNKEARYAFSVKQNQTFNDINTQIGLDNARGSTVARQIQINQPIEQPDYMGAILGGLDTGMAVHKLGSKAGAFSGLDTPKAVPSGLGAGSTDLFNLNPSALYG